MSTKPGEDHRIETVVDVEDKTCPCCSGALHLIGEDRAERLDIVPAQLRVLVVRRPKYACRACEDVVVQSPAPTRLIEGGIPTDATVAMWWSANTPITCRSTARRRSTAGRGSSLISATLADWTGRAAFLLRPVHEHLLATLRRSPKLFADEATARCWIPAAAAPRLASSGPTRATTAQGAELIRGRWPTSMRLTARPNGRWRTSLASAACCRWMAMAATAPCREGSGSARLLLGPRPQALL